MFTDDQGVKRETPDEMGIERKLDLILAELKKIEGAFPRNEDGEPDVEGHRRFHDAKIKAAEEEAQFWKELKMEVAKKGLAGAWGLLIIIAGLALVGASTKFGITLK